MWRRKNHCSVGVALVLLNGTLLRLAMLKHWFMVQHLPSQALWNWGLRWPDTWPAA
jgi:hypothetical protein